MLIVYPQYVRNLERGLKLIIITNDKRISPQYVRNLERGLKPNYSTDHDVIIHSVRQKPRKGIETSSSSLAAAADLSTSETSKGD